MEPQASVPPRSAPAQSGARYATAIAALARHRNPDGGWAYAPGKSSRIEPTCWALLATASATRQPVDPGVLRRWPTRDGWLVDVAGAPVNYAFNALAGLTLLTHRDSATDATRIGTALLNVRGLALPQAPMIRQDNSLQAWSWIDSTFSWVEPTSWCVLLLKKLRRQIPEAAATDRIRIGERLLVDRACRAGGWNYGGSNAYGQELYPYVSTTGLGLMALQDLPTEPVVISAINWLRKESLSERSLYAMALGLMGLTTHGASSPGLQEAAEQQVRDVSERPNLMALAAGLFALTRPPHGDDAFTI